MKATHFAVNSSPLVNHIWLIVLNYIGSNTLIHPINIINVTLQLSHIILRPILLPFNICTKFITFCGHNNSYYYLIMLNVIQGLIPCIGNVEPSFYLF